MGSHEADGVPPGEFPDNDRPQVATENPGRLSKEQIYILIATASINFSSMICYSILGPFFPKEAEKKGASSTIVGFIFGCFALFNFLTSLIMGKYLVQIGAKFMFVSGMFVSGCATILFGMLDRAPDGPIFIGLCFLIRAVDAIGFSAAITASFSILAKAFPNNIATVLGSLEIFTGLGLVLGPPIGGFLYQSFGYEVPFLVLGCAVLILVPLNMYLLPKYGPAPILHIESKLWLFVLMLVLIGFSLGMIGIPLFPEIISYAYENGFEEGLSLLGLVSGLFNAMWSVGSFVGPTLGGFLNDKLGFEWAAAIQGGFPLLSGLAVGTWYLYETSHRRRSIPENLPSTDQERAYLLSSET